ncbi:MAG: MerR family transcriptional regulator [Planctomycetota bacterium]
MPDSIPRLATIGEVARLLKTPLHRIEYVLRSRPHIRPRATAGGARCFDDEAIAEIRHELTAIDARRLTKARNIL